MIRGVSYTIDIEALTQTNDSTGTARTIRRRVLRESAGGEEINEVEDSSGETLTTVTDNIGFRGSVWEEFCSMTLDAGDRDHSSETILRSFSFDASTDFGTVNSDSTVPPPLRPPVMPMPPASISSAVYRKVTS